MIELKKEKNTIFLLLFLFSLLFLIFIAGKTFIEKQEEKKQAQYPHLNYWNKHSEVKECLPIKKINSDHSLVDIYASMSHCFYEGDSNTAAEMYFIGGLFQEFDYERVANHTRYDVTYLLSQYSINVLYEVFIPLEVAQREHRVFWKTFRSLVDNSNDICKDLKKIGYPTYHPSYMINDNSRSNKIEQDEMGFVINFNPDETWEEIMSKYCYK